MKRKHSRCDKCKVFITLDEFQCYNCGYYFLERHRRYLALKYVLPISIIVFTVLQLAISLSRYDIESWAYFRLSFLNYLFFSSLLFGFIFALPTTLIAYLLTPKLRNPARRKRDHNLDDLPLIIKDRISELKNRQQQIRGVLAGFREDENEHLLSIKEKLLTAQQTLESQISRYILYSKRLELVKIQQKLMPVLSNLENSNYEESKHHLHTVKDSLKRINKLNVTVEQQETPQLVLREKNDVLSHIEEMRLSCEKLREILLISQAADAITNISPLEEVVHKDFLQNDIIKKMTTFNIQVELTDFSQTFGKLEAEYQRLKLESDIRREIEESGVK